MVYQEPYAKFKYSDIKHSVEAAIRRSYERIQDRGRKAESDALALRFLEGIQTLGEAAEHVYLTVSDYRRLTKYKDMH